MNKNRVLTLILTFVVVAGLFVPVTASAGRISMLVVPARYSVMQVAFDLASRFPMVLVSYQGDATTEDPVIHAWNGQEWVRVSADDYREGRFLQEMPTDAILIGDEQLLPPAMSAISTWCPKVDTIPTVQTADILNSMANILRFKEGDWEWFTARYNLKLNDLNAEQRTGSWYNRSSYEDEYTERMKKFRVGGRYPASSSAPVAEEAAPVTPVEVPAEPEAAPAMEQAPAPATELAPAPAPEAAPAAPEPEAPVK